MQIKLTRNEFKKALENNDQYEYPLNNETINQLRSVFLSRKLNMFICHFKNINPFYP